jgi:hypothetical protein
MLFQVSFTCCNMSREERKQEELKRMMVYVGAGKAAGHIAIRVHAAHKCGATKEDIYQRIVRVARWGMPPSPLSSDWGLGAWFSCLSSLQSSA